MAWHKDLRTLGPVVLALVLTFGIALYIGGQFYTALTPNSLNPGQASNGVNAIIANTASGLTTYMPIIITVIFLVIVYKVVEGSGLFKSKGSDE
jgi:hypothetical protein